jgi:hypothetical protein
MRLRLAVLLTIVSLGAVAQRGGGMPMGHTGGGGHWGNPLPIPPRFPGMGRNPWHGGRPGFGPYVTGYPFMGFDTPLCASPLFPLAPDCSFGDMGGSAYYPPPPMNPAPVVNVAVMPPPPPLPPPVRIVRVPAADNQFDPSQAGSNIPSPANSADVSQEGPVGNSAVPEKFPPLIVLKTGAYSVHKYWVKNETLYFETISGNTLYAPLSLLVRIVPAR